MAVPRNGRAAHAALTWNRTPVLQREGLEWLRDAMLAAVAIRTRFAYEDCVDMRFAEVVVREEPPALAEK
mgnify:FL=1